MAKQFTVSMQNGLGRPIDSGDVSVEADVPTGWKLVHQQDGVQHTIQSNVPYDVPLPTSVPEDEAVEMTFIVGASPVHPAPSPPEGEMTLRFFYNQTPLNDMTLYLPPGREPAEE